MAHALMFCNQKMGGVDLFNQFFATIGSKKRCLPFFTWSLNAVMTNAWLLYKEIHCKNIPVLSFMRKIVASMLASSKRKKLPSLQYTQQVLENLRTDKLNHVVIEGQSVLVDKITYYSSQKGLADVLLFFQDLLY